MYNVFDHFVMTVSVPYAVIPSQFRKIEISVAGFNGRTINLLNPFPN